MSPKTDRTEHPSMRGLLVWSTLIILSAGMLLYLTLAGSVGGGDGDTLLRPNAPASDNSFSPGTGGDDADPSSDQGGDGSSGWWAILVSGLTLATSTVGLVFNTWMGWRKELRDAQKGRLEAQQLRVELEKTLLEVQLLREELKSETR